MDAAVRRPRVALEGRVPFAENAPLKARGKQGKPFEAQGKQSEPFVPQGKPEWEKWGYTPRCFRMSGKYRTYGREVCMSGK